MGDIRSGVGFGAARSSPNSRFPSSTRTSDVPLQPPAVPKFKNSGARVLGSPFSSLKREVQRLHSMAECRQQPQLGHAGWRDAGRRRRSRLRTRDLDLGLGPPTPSPDSDPSHVETLGLGQLVRAPSHKSKPQVEDSRTWTWSFGLGTWAREPKHVRPSRPLLQDSPSGTWDSSGNPPTRRPSRKLPSRTWDSECKLESRPPSLRFDETLSSHLKHGHAGGRSTWDLGVENLDHIPYCAMYRVSAT